MIGHMKQDNFEMPFIMEASEMLVEQHPYCKHTELRLVQMGNYHYQTGNHSKAAAFYLQYARQYHTRTNALEYLERAIKLFRGLGDEKKTQAALRVLAQLFVSSEE